MKKFDEITFNYDLCRAQFSQFRSLLETNEELGESGDILPFLRERRQLAVLLGMFNPRIGWADRIAYEFDIFGDFSCDLAVGEWANGSYCFIEFEDAQKDSVFKRGEKATREWSPRFDHGFSQIVDWCHKLHDRANSADMVSRFGQHTINFETVLVIGRDRHIDAGERLRLDWRSSFVMVNSKKVHCMTFDQLLNQLSARLSVLSMVAPQPSAVAPGTDSPGPAPPSVQDDSGHD